MAQRLVWRVQWRSVLERWVVVRPRSMAEGPTPTFSTKLPAVRFAAAEARAAWSQGKLAQLMIHKKDGDFQDERTYGEDPRRSRG